jgi:hypothetical protein
MISCYELMLSLKFTVRARNQTLGTFTFCMALHLTTKYFSCTAIWTLHSDIQTPLITSGGKVLLVCTDLQHCLAAMLPVGAVNFQLSSLPASWLHEHVGEILGVTVRAGLILLQPFFKTVPTELLSTAVHHVRLTQHSHANRASQIFRWAFNKIVLKLNVSHCKSTFTYQTNHE